MAAGSCHAWCTLNNKCYFILQVSDTDATDTELSGDANSELVTSLYWFNNVYDS